MIVSLLAPGCQKQEGDLSKQEDVQDKATTLIERGQNDEAIRLMIEELKKNPVSDRSRQILASAYANRAGIRVENYYGFAVTYNSLIKGPEDFSKKNSAEENVDISEIFPALPDQAKNALRQLAPNLAIIQKIRGRLIQVPLVNAEQSKDLLLAVEVLRPTTSPGAHVYRAILDLIVLRSHFDRNIQLIGLAASEDGCQRNLDIAMRSLQSSFGLLQQFLDDLAQAYPSSAANLLGTQQQLESILNEMPSQAQKTRLLLCHGS